MSSVILTSIVEDDKLRFNHTILRKVHKSIFLNNFKDVNKSRYVWGITSSKNHLENWKKVTPGDYVFFYIDGNYRYLGKIVIKLDNKEIAGNLWKRYHLFAESFHLLLFFNNIIPISIPLQEFNIISNRKLPESSLQGAFFLVVDSERVRKVIPQIKSIEEALKLLSPLPQTYIATDYKEPPSKTKFFVTRYIRDTTKSIQLKEEYDNFCQICGYRISINSEYYSEVHHIWPLGEGGYDNFDNMLVLCPNHHAEFDLAVIGVDLKDGTSVVDREGNRVGKLALGTNHHLKISNLKYQLKRMQDTLK